MPPLLAQASKGSARTGVSIATPTFAPAATISPQVASSSAMPSRSRARRAARSGSPAICTASKPAPGGLCRSQSTKASASCSKLACVPSLRRVDQDGEHAVDHARARCRPAGARCRCR